MIFFGGGGGGALALDDGACDPLLFQKGGIFPTTNKTLRGHSYHLIFHIKQVFMLIEISKIHIGGYSIIKTGRRKNGLTFSVGKYFTSSRTHMS